MAAFRNVARGAAVAALLLMVEGKAEAAAIEEATAAEVMAAYMRYIAVLTTWPAERLADADGPMIIGVAGADPNGVMEPIRKKIASEGLTAQGREIRVVNLELPASATQSLEAALAPCALLFFTEGAQGEWAQSRSALARLPVVTVSEMEGFAERGGMIEYAIDRAGKVRLIVNLRELRKAGIVLSARLLTLDSVVVLDEKEEPE